MEAPIGGEEGLREAIDVAVRGAGDQVEVQLGHLCCNRCVFCVSGQLTMQGLASRIPEARVQEALAAAAGGGVRRLTLLGGEPTLQPGFLPALRAAVDLGFDEITIFTNGARGRDARFLAEVLDVGRFTWRLSVQGGDEATHDRTVGRSGAFGNLLAGMRWLGDHGCDLTANTCACGQNHRSLAALPELLLDHGVRQHHVDLVRPGGAGVRSDDEILDLLPPLPDLAASIDAMIAAVESRDPDWDLRVGNLPFCLLPRRAGRIEHGGEPTATVTTDDRGALARVWRKYDYQRSGMVHPAACSGCSMRALCRGIPAEHLRLRGEAGLVPVGKEVLEARERWLSTREGRGDPAGSRPVGGEAEAGDRIMARLLLRARRLRSLALRGGWRWAASRVGHDGRSIEIDFVGPDGARARVVLLPEGIHLQAGEGISAERARNLALALGAAGVRMSQP